MALNLRNLRDRSRDDDDMEIPVDAPAAEAAVTPPPSAEPVVKAFPIEDLLPYVVKGLAPRSEEAEKDVIVHLLGQDALSGSPDKVRNDLTIEILSRAPDLGAADEATLTESNRDAWIAQQAAKFGPSIPLSGMSAPVASASAAVATAAVAAVEAVAEKVATRKPGKLNLRSLSSKSEATEDDDTPSEAAAAASDGIVTTPKVEEDEYSAALKDVIAPSAPPSIHDPVKPLRPEVSGFVPGSTDRARASAATPGGDQAAAGNDPYSKIVSDLEQQAHPGQASGPEGSRNPNNPSAAAVARDDEREAERQAGMNGMRQAPGNALDTLFNVAAAPIVGAAMGIAHGVRKFREILANRAGSGERGFSPEALRERIFEAKVDGLRKGAVGIVEAGEELGRDVESFNDAFLSSSAASKLKKIADAEGKTVTQFLAELSSGKGKAEHLSLARDAMAEPTVKAAWEKVEAGLGKMDEKSQETRRGLEELTANFPDRIDPEAEANGLAAAHDAATKKIPAPAFEDPEAGEKLRDRLKKMVERMVEWAKEFLAKIIERFTSAAKPG